MRKDYKMRSVGVAPIVRTGKTPLGVRKSAVSGSLSFFGRWYVLVHPALLGDVDDFRPRLVVHCDPGASAPPVVVVVHGQAVVPGHFFVWSAVSPAARPSPRTHHHRGVQRHREGDKDNQVLRGELRPRRRVRALKPRGRGGAEGESSRQGNRAG